MLQVLYYNYYLFYTKVIPDDEPHATTVFTLSFTEALYIIGITDFISVYFFCHNPSKEVYIGVLVIVLILNYLTLHRSGKNKAIIHAKPLLINDQVSAVTTFLFCLIGVSWLFWGSFLSKSLLEAC